MKKYGGLVHCVCGDFKWRTYELQSGEYIVGRLDELNKNCVNHTVINGICHATVECPVCRKRFTAQDPE